MHHKLCKKGLCNIYLKMIECLEYHRMAPKLHTPKTNHLCTNKHLIQSIFVSIYFHDFYFYYNFDHCIPHTYQKSTTAPNTKEIIQKNENEKKKSPTCRPKSPTKPNMNCT